MPNAELPKDEADAQQAEGGASSGLTGEQGTAAASYSGTNEDRLRQEQEIEDMIRSRPPVGKLEDLTSLEEELRNNESFSRKVGCLTLTMLRRKHNYGACRCRI